MTQLDQKRRGILFILSAPAGTGKNTLVHRLCADFPQIVESTSCTTRPQRPDEREGDHYHFLSSEEFSAKLKEGAFLEYAELFGHRYGTLQSEVEEVLREGQHVILVIDTQGAMQLRDRLSAVFIFLAPPSHEELERRLRGRQTEGEEAIAERLRRSKEELAAAHQYDYHVVNDDLETAYEVLRSIVIAEEHRIP